MTAVMRLAEAVLQAFIMMRSSMSPSLISPGAVDCRIKTITPHISCMIVQGWRIDFATIFISDTFTNSDGGLLVGVLEN